MRDRRAVAAVARRVLRLRQGNFGDAKRLEEGVVELRIDLGPGYRVYFTGVGSRVTMLLCGGDKSSQNEDIGRARELAARAREKFDGPKN